MKPNLFRSKPAPNYTKGNHRQLRRRKNTTKHHRNKLLQWMKYFLQMTVFGYSLIPNFVWTFLLRNILKHIFEYTVTSPIKTLIKTKGIFFYKIYNPLTAQYWQSWIRVFFSCLAHGSQTYCLAPMSFLSSRKARWNPSAIGLFPSRALDYGTICQWTYVKRKRFSSSNLFSKRICLPWTYSYHFVSFKSI